jgi:hypothetical protein
MAAISGLIEGHRFVAAIIDRDSGWTTRGTGLTPPSSLKIALLL